MSDFFYECEGCKAKVPATFEDPSPSNVQMIVKPLKEKSETTFRCGACRLPMDGNPQET